MTAPAGIRQADLSRMAAVARDKNVCIEMEINGNLIRVTPLTSEEKPIPQRKGIRL